MQKSVSEKAGSALSGRKRLHIRAEGLSFLMYAGLVVGLIAVSFLAGTYALLDLRPSLPLFVLGFCGTFLVYQVDRSLGLSPEDLFNQPGRLDWLRQHRRYVVVSSLIALSGGLAVLPLLRAETLMVCAGLGLLSILYVVPVLPRGRRLKTVWFLKPLAIATAWTAGGVLLPVVEAGRAITPAVLFLFVYRFLFVLPNALLADNLDRAGDAQAGLRTVATVFSDRRIRQVAAGLLLLAVAGALLLVAAGQAPPFIGIDLAGPLLMLAMVLRPPAAMPRLYVFWLDLVVAWPLMTALAIWMFGV